MAQPPSRAGNRYASRTQRRLQLIKATVDSIARRGFAETTLANVAEGAGLSQGTVNFHFESKERLLEETLRFLAEEYRAAWQAALGRAGADPAARLEALVLVDFEPHLCNRKKIAVWHAFYGEARSRPTYLALCEQKDQEHFEVLRALCAELVGQGGYRARDPALVANGFSALSDGLWLAVLISPQSCDRDTARRTSLAFLESTFPRHFPLARVARAAP